MMYDFHTHTLLSDGVLSPIELIRRAVVNGYRAVCIADHCGTGYLPRIIHDVTKDCEMARRNWDIMAIPGVELTHVPVGEIAFLASQAKELGAQIVVVHGESIVEPVEVGTNLAAVSSPHVDILAHPGLITLHEAQLAASNNVFLEISARKGHCLTNGHVARMAKIAGAKLLLDSDAHDVGDLLTKEKARNIARGAGLDEAEIEEVLEVNPTVLLERIRLSPAV